MFRLYFILEVNKKVHMYMCYRARSAGAGAGDYKSYLVKVHKTKINKCRVWTLTVNMGY